MYRIDPPRQTIPEPHPVMMPEDILKSLIAALQREEIDLASFARQLGPYPAILRRVLQAANSVASGNWQSIKDPAHAAAYLGSRRLIQLLLSLPKESLIAE